MFTIRQTDAGWELVNADGERVGEIHEKYDGALASLATLLEEQLAADPQGEAAAGAGLLPEMWEDVAGIAFSAETGDGRDFTQCSWSFRDLGTSTLPLMLQTETDMGHMGATLAGYFAEADVVDGTPTAAGYFYDNEAGRQARDMLLDGRRFGVSVDPGSVDAEFECIEEDDDGWCVEAKWNFLAYQIIGLTMTPFPGFADAAIQLRGADSSSDDEDADAGEPVTASSAPALPLAEWFHMPEPDPTESDLYVEQEDGGLAIPLQITDDGRVFGHLARWEQCHTGFPGACVSPPSSPSAYASFHLGETECADGERVCTGPLFVGTDHADLGLFAAGARDHYAHTGLAWADVRVVDGAYGPWMCGVLRPTVTDDQRRVLQASMPSGDWRRTDLGLDLIAVLTVNNPGFPIRREAIAASGLRSLPTVRLAGRVRSGQQEALVASALVRRPCGDCDKPKGKGSLTVDVTAQLAPELVDVLGQIGAALDRLDRRTRHLAPAAAEHARAAVLRR